MNTIEINGRTWEWVASPHLVTTEDRRIILFMSLKSINGSGLTLVLNTSMTFPPLLPMHRKS